MIDPPDRDDVTPPALYPAADMPCDVQPEVGWFLASVMFEDPVMASLTHRAPRAEDHHLS
ncbi:MAG: hypothetical protein ACOC95_05285 [Planctomycetota bacterium]